MSVMDDVAEEARENAVAGIALSVFKTRVWQWYHQHQDDVILHKWWFAVHLRDLHAVVEAIIGPE